MKIKIGFFSVMLFLSLLLFHSYFALASFIAVTVHELGHIFAARIRGIRFSECNISIYGAGLTPSASDYSYRDEILLCIGGPAVNLLSAVMLLPLYVFFRTEILLFFISASLALGLLNLLPIKDFDGGRILHSLLCIVKDPYTAEKVLSVVSFIFIFILWTVSVYFLLMAKSNLSLFIFSLSLFFKIFVKEN